MNFNSIKHRKASKQLKWVAYFMAFPNWVFVQNISFFLLILFYRTTSLQLRSFIIRGKMSIAAVVFGFGATFSVMGSGLKYGLDSFINSLKILPNYIYWAFIVIFIGNLGLSVLRINDVYKSFFWGLVSLVITYFFLNPIFSFLPFYNASSANSFAFLLILFSPMATAYVQVATEKKVFTVIFILLVTLVGFLSGSRSGSLLTFAGCFLTLLLNSRSKSLFFIILPVFILVSLPILTNNQTIKNIIFNLNDRTYSLIYETEEVINSDMSYLTRLAMIEKSIVLFRENIISGVGLGNYGMTNVDLDFSFDGGELLISKRLLIEKGMSAHNSYLSVLAEGGILLFFPLVVLILYPIGYFIINYNSILGYEKAIFISIIFMSIHVWFISALLNVYGWFVLGLANSYILHKKGKF